MVTPLSSRFDGPKQPVPGTTPAEQLKEAETLDRLAYLEGQVHLLEKEVLRSNKERDEAIAIARRLDELSKEVDPGQ